MCGIVGSFNKDLVSKGVAVLLHRGPDAQDIITVGKITLGHTRLAILDLDARSNQPFNYRDINLVFNGEIWNYKQLRDELRSLGCVFTTESDTEVVAVALQIWGLDTLKKLNGMFAIAWTVDGDRLYLARDKYGEIPLHIAKQNPFSFASEIKALISMGCNPKSISLLSSGSYAVVTSTSIVEHSYYDISTLPNDDNREQASKQIFNLINTGSLERTISDVPVCTLLSGGIDSAAIAYCLKQSIPNLVAYTAVLDTKSKDLKCAREVANLLDIKLIEVNIPHPTPSDLISVIHCIEMDYKAQVEIGWACLVLAKRMKRDGFKVVFSGEGSDELWASYGFAYHALQTQNWHSYRKDLFLSQSRKNFIRCNKIFMSNSIECRLPFLNSELVEYAIALKKDSVQNGKSKPKAVIQDAFRGKLPLSIIERQKVAFQDGLGLKEVISNAIANPKVFYTSEFKKIYA
jgi:asparagine synthase (glutamine-hydrolysing)